VRRFGLLAALVVLGMAPAAASAPPAPAAAALMEAAGVDFPERIGPFELGEIRMLRPGLVVAAYVRTDETRAAPSVQILVSRATAPPAVALADNETLIESAASPVVALRDLPPPARAPGAVGRLWRAGTGRDALLVGIILWQRDGWEIRVRAVFSGAAGEAAWAEVQPLIDNFDWGRAPARAPDAA